MLDNDVNRIILHTEHIASACKIDCCVFDLSQQGFQKKSPGFCNTCPYKAGGCTVESTHLFGSLEAERWNGLYIYHCLAELLFVAAIIYENAAPALSIIGGPVVIGAAADMLDPSSLLSADMLDNLPSMPPARFTSISQVIHDISMFLSDITAKSVDEKDLGQTRLNNTLYDITSQIDQTNDYMYPLELESKLSKMISQGDKNGAREIINELLGHLYFSHGGDFDTMKDHAAGLVLLFSRTAIEGGADARKIFSEIRAIMEKIHACENIDDLSVFLTEVFHRFVGYVFDFVNVKHIGIIQKAVEYIRSNYMRRITLDEVADHVFLSKSYLSTIFNNEMNCSVTAYINSLRINRSRELLLQNDIAIVDICNLVGFDNQSYFTKVFRSSVGVSPGKYRKTHGKV